jgi:hypothetical protein
LLLTERDGNVETLREELLMVHKQVGVKDLLINTVKIDNQVLKSEKDTSISRADLLHAQVRQLQEQIKELKLTNENISIKKGNERMIICEEEDGYDNALDEPPGDLNNDEEDPTLGFQLGR